MHSVCLRVVGGRKHAGVLSTLPQCPRGRLLSSWCCIHWAVVLSTCRSCVSGNKNPVGKLRPKGAVVPDYIGKTCNEILPNGLKSLKKEHTPQGASWGRLLSLSFDPHPLPNSFHVSPGTRSFPGHGSLEYASWCFPRSHFMPACSVSVPLSVIVSLILEALSAPSSPSPWSVGSSWTLLPLSHSCLPSAPFLWPSWLWGPLDPGRLLSSDVKS